MTHATLGTRIAIALSALGLVAAAAPVCAQTLDDNRQIVVSYGDLDLGHAAGQGALRQRVETAATAVCGPAPDLRVLNDWAAFQRCRTAAIRGATPQMDRARLEAQPQLASR